MFFLCRNKYHDENVFNVRVLTAPLRYTFLHAWYKSICIPSSCQNILVSALYHGHMQIKDEQLESFAACCRSQIRSWIAAQECTKWQGDYKNHVVREVVLATKQRREILEDAARQLMETNPGIINEIQKTIEKDLKRSQTKSF